MTGLERVPGQEDREGGGLRLDQHHPAAVRRRHRPRQRQPQPGPLGTAADAPLEDPGHQFRRDALALVPDLDHDRARTLRGLQGHRSPAVHERVIQQRGEHLGQPARGDVSLQAAHADHHELALHPAEGRLPLDDLLPDDLVDAGEGGRSRGRPPGRAEQLGHHVGQALGLGEGGAAFLPDHLGVVRRRDHLFQPHRQGGQRGAQLVRGVHRELTIRGEQAAEPARGRVEPVGHLVEVGHPVPAAERARVACPEPRGRLGEFLDRPGQPAREHGRQPAGQRGRRDHQRGDHGQRGRPAAGVNHQGGHAHDEDGDDRDGKAREPQPPAHRSPRGEAR